MVKSVWRRHRRSVRFIKNLLKKKNAPAPPRGTRTENTFLRYHLVCRFPDHSATVPTHRLPLTQAIRQQILREHPFPSALGGPFAAPLFAPLSAAGTLCGCAAQFYFRLKGLLVVTLFNYTYVRLSRTFFHMAWKRLPLYRGCDKISSKLKLEVFLWIME